MKDRRMQHAGMYGLLSEIVSKGSLDVDLIERVREAIAEYEENYRRPANYADLSPAEQWEIDKRLGLLDEPVKEVAENKDGKAPLIPPDTHQCQGEVRKGGPYSFMTLGPIPPLTRCTNAPTWIATEAKPGADGLCGSMSLCDNCREAMIEMLGPDFATFEPIRESDKN